MESMVTQLTALKFLSVRLYLRADETLRLPAYKGSTLRGAFGRMFKDVVCVIPHRDCPRCVLRSNCAYPYVFETPVPETAQRMRKYPSAPHPFVILPTLEDKRQYNAGDIFHFDLILIGRGIDYLPYFIHTFAQFSTRRGLGADRGKCTLASAQWQETQGQGVSIYDDGDQELREECQPISIESLLDDELDADAVRIQFLTPTRIVQSGRLASDLPFHFLVRTLLRRVSNLMYFHCGTELDVDFRSLIRQSEQVEIASNELQWYDWKRYSSRQQRHIKQGGLVGSVSYRGNLHPFWPLLKLGEFIHVGKSTSFGLGKYQVEAVNTGISA